MMKFLAFAGALLAAGLGACAGGGDETEETDPGPGSGGSGAEGGEANGGTAGMAEGGSGGTPVDGVTYTGTIEDGFTMAVIPDVSVCVLDPPLDCVQTDSAGMFTHPGVPKNLRVRVGASKNTYFPIESLIDVTDVDGQINALMLNETIITIALNQVGVTFDNTKPAISMTVRDVNGATLSGYSFSISPQGVGEGPYYLNTMGVVQGATSTTTVGTGFYVNMEPGTYAVTVSGPTQCNAAYITDAPNTHTAPLINPAQFVIVFDC